MKLYFARHGESEANVQQVFWSQPEGYGLTDRGVDNAFALAHPIDYTASIVAELHRGEWVCLRWGQEIL